MAASDSDADAEARRRTKVALPWRLPNPPTTFHGRRAERSLLAAAIRRGPLVRVWGPAGIGKTGLVLDVLHGAFADRVDRILYVSASGLRDERGLMTAILRAIQDGSGRSALNWPDLMRDVVGAATVLLDVVDESDLWVVIDDLEARETHEHLLSLIEAYCRSGRWIAIHRPRPVRRVTPGQSLEVGPLPVEALRAIASGWGEDVSADYVRRALEAARGSPWRLEEGLYGAQPMPSTRLQEQRRQELRLLGVLAAVQGALPLSVLDALDVLPDEPRRRALIDRGLVSRRGDALCLEPRVLDAQAYPVVRDRRLDAALLLHLEAGSDLGMWMQALELATDLGDEAAVSRIFEAHGDDLISEGFAPRVAALFADETDPERRTWCWQARSIMGLDVDVDAWRLSTDGEPRTIRYVLNALHRLARWGDVIRLSEQYIARWSDAPEQAEWIRHIRVSCAWAMFNQSRLDEARAMLPEIDDIVSPRVCSAAMALEARLLIARGDEDAAYTIALEMWRRLRSTPEPARKRGVYATIYVFYQLQRLEEAERIAQAAIGDEDWATLPAEYDCHILMMLAALHGERARFDDALRYTRRAETFLSRNPAVLSILLVGNCRTLLYTGAHAGLVERLRRLRSDAVSLEQPDVVESIDLCILEAQIALGPAIANQLVGLPEIADERHPDEEVIAAIDAVRRVRWGEPHRRDAGDTGSTEATCWWALYRGYRAMLAGQSAVDGLWAARAPVRVRGLGRMGLQLQQALCEALLLEGRDSALPAEIDELAGWAAQSRRFRAEVDFFRLCLDPTRTADWEAFAEGPFAANRRARAVLGLPATLDRIDALVVDAIRARRGPTTARTLPWSGAESGRRWGMDAARGVLWSDGGHTLDLTRARILRRLLTTLAEAGGAASKEALVTEVWEVDRYHPLNHDNRLRLAVRKLRGLIARELELEDALVTTEDGYALRPPFRWIAGSARPGEPGPDAL